MTGGHARKQQYGIPWSDEELKALEPYVKGRIKGKYRNCYHAAREYQARVEESTDGRVGGAARRTLRAIHSRIWERVRGREWQRSADWSREELRVVDRYVRSLALARAGRRSIRAIIRSCHSDLRRLHAAHPRAVWAQQDRNPRATESVLHARARRLGLRWAGAWWTRPESSLIESHAQALAEGRFEGAPDAAKHCLERLERLRLRDPRLAARRTLASVADRIARRARRLGWTYYWTPQELQALEPHARGLVRGKYRFAKDAVAALEARKQPSRARSASAVIHALRKRARTLGRPARAGAWAGEDEQRLDWYVKQVVKGLVPDAAQAAREFLAERERLRRRRPDASRLSIRRTLKGVHNAILKRARGLGRPPLAIRWSLPEQEICRRYARLLLQGEFKDASEATRSAVSAIAELHRQHPTERWANMRRTYHGTSILVRKLAGATHQRWANTCFSSEENDVMNRHAQGVMEGRFPTIKRAAQACWEELDRRHRRSQQGLPPALKTPQLRSLSSVRSQVRLRSLAMGRAKRRITWVPAEMEVALKWSREFLLTRESHGRLSESEAGRRMSTELKRNGFDRKPEYCIAKLHGIVHGWRPGERSRRGQPLVSSRDLARGTYPIRQVRQTNRGAIAR
jgi:hypothetical protein